VFLRDAFDTVLFDGVFWVNICFLLSLFYEFIDILKDRRQKNKFYTKGLHIRTSYKDFILGFTELSLDSIKLLRLFMK
ncbi:MAG TPA: hypothetical protein DD412_02675, partial [Holosporales bacterium]|nr:hypothetical protein [Holosporales bacterium]